MELKKYTLGEIGDVSMCKRIMKEETNSLGGIPFYKIGTFGGVADSFISEEKYIEYKTKYSYPHIGDILFSAAGTIGRCVVFNGEDSYFQDCNIVWLKNDEKKVLNSYLYYVLQNVKWKVSPGCVLARLYNDDIRKTEVFLPPLSDQKKIAHVLSTLDRKIALNRAINRNLAA